MTKSESMMTKNESKIRKQKKAGGIVKTEILKETNTRATRSLGILVIPDNPAFFFINLHVECQKRI